MLTSSPRLDPFGVYGIVPSVVSPSGERVEHVSTPDPATTNLCFGGPDLRTAFVTLSGTGRLMAVEWARPGLRLNHQRVAS